MHVLSTYHGLLLQYTYFTERIRCNNLSHHHLANLPILDRNTKRMNEGLEYEWKDEPYFGAILCRFDHIDFPKYVTLTCLDKRDERTTKTLAGEYY